MTSPLFINGRFLTQPLKGVQRFALGITEQLVALGVPLKVVVPDAPRINDCPAPVERVGRLDGHAWEQIDLPRYLRRQGSPLLLNFGNTAPLLYRNQIVTVHDVAFIHHPQSYPRAFRAYYRLLIPQLIKRSRRTLTVSEFSRKEILAAYPRTAAEDISVVYNAADTRFAAEADANVGDANSRPRFLAFASDSDLKNDRIVHDAFIALADERDIELRVVGLSSRFPEADRIRQVGRNSRIVTLGRIDDQVLASEYRHATAFIFGPKYAGFGIPPIEAQASGCPVLASRAASLPEVLGDSAIFFDPTNTTELVQGMKRILDEPAWRETLVARGHVNEKRFTWEGSARQVYSVVEALSAG